MDKGSHIYWECSHPEACPKANSYSIRANQWISSDTFFNSFFLAHWRRLTTLKSLALRLNFQGKFLLQIFLHTNLGEAAPIAEHEIGENGDQEIQIPFSLEAIPPGLRLSFRLTAREDCRGTLIGQWETEDVARAPFSVAIGITTFNRQDYAEKTIRRLMDDSALKAENIFIWLVDQSDASQLEHLNGPNCCVLRQNNLGGAGGFSRVIYESLQDHGNHKTTHLLLMDDDIDLETDSVLRIMRFAQYARSPCLLDGTMLDIYRPNVAWTMGGNLTRNAADGYDLFYGIGEHLPFVDVSAANVKNAISLPAFVNFCPWWFCLIPMETISKMGLPAPLFIRGDDLEYGYRAFAEGFPSCTLPGIGLWHVPFYSKMAPWLRYFETYNHLILNTRHGFESLQDLFHFSIRKAVDFLSLHHYQHASAMVRGLEDFLGGWQHFRKRTFPDYLTEIRQELATYDLNEKGSVANPAQIEALKKRMQAVIVEFNKNGLNLQRDFSEHLSLSFTAESWSSYFKNGNLLHLAK